MRTSITDIKKKKHSSFSMLTAYDYSTAKIVESSGIEIILVGDSLGQVVLGYDTPVMVTKDDILHHLRAVVRATSKSHIVADMPFLSYQTDESTAIKNAGTLLQKGNAQSIKLEGGESIAELVNKMVKIGIPVMGHIGLTPQSVNQFGGFKIQGKNVTEASKIINDALCLEESGAYSIVLEGIPTEVSKIITEKLSIPTIGIGAGQYCDGQVQVIHDILGLYPDFSPKHAKQYINLSEIIQNAIKEFISDVENKSFPNKTNSSFLKNEVAEIMKKHFS